MTTPYGTYISKQDKEWLETMSKEQLFINYRGFMEQNKKMKALLENKLGEIILENDTHIIIEKTKE